jgi:serine/threonine protein kinase
MEQVFGRFQAMESIENYPGHFNTCVYRAVDSSTNRLVALQTVWPEDCTIRPDLISSGFAAEVAAVSKLVHLNIAEMIDFGVAGSQGYVLYVAYEWVGGRSLRGLLDANARQSLVTTREILSPVAAALDYAHSRGVVHGLLIRASCGCRTIGFRRSLASVWPRDSLRWHGTTGAARRSLTSPRSNCRFRVVV